METRPLARGDVRLMLDFLSEEWPHGRGPGYAFMAQRLPYDDWDARLWFEGGRLAGWGWRVRGHFSYACRDASLLDEIVPWAGVDETTVRSGDDAAAEMLARHGFEFDADAPWIRENARTLDEIEAPVAPGGYRLTTMAEYGDFASRASAHRSAFRPSRFTDRVYRTVREETPWLAELDCVLVDPEGEVVAYALGWLDARNRLGELEPVGVRRPHHRRGFGRAVCLFALQQLKAAGAETAIVGSRGDDGYPAPRLLYESIGFRERVRDLPFTRAS